MTTARHQCGFRSPQTPTPHEAIAGLAHAVAAHARTLGLTVVAVKASRIRSSPSRHVQLRDRHGRDWFLRLSDHRAPRCTGYARPHFELVTRDGGTGAELAFGFVGRVSRGEEAWSVPERGPARKGIRPRGKGPRR